MSVRSAQVVVIGGGVIGTAITYYLARQGVDVALVERGDIASGTSSACSGSVMMQTKGTGVKLKLALESREIYRSLNEELSNNVEYYQEGGMIVAETEEEIDYISSLAKRQRELGLKVELLDRKQAKERQPALSNHVLASTFCPLDGKVNPMKVAFSFAEAAKKKGAKIYTFTSVKNIQVRKGKVFAVVVDHGKIKTKVVVNAGGIWAPEIGKMVGLKIPIRPRRGMLIVTEVIPPTVNGSILSAKYMMSKYAEGDVRKFTGGLALRHTEEGNLLFGSSREFVGYDKRTTYEGVSFIIQEAVRILPVLRNVNVIRTFAGLRPATPDGLPILGEASHPKGFIIAAGQEGDGIALAPITGKLIGDLITKGEFPNRFAQLNLQRFSKDFFIIIYVKSLTAER